MSGFSAYRSAFLVMWHSSGRSKMTTGSNSGSAYVSSEIEWRMVSSQKLVAPDGAADTAFGYSVSVEGDLAIIGSSHDDSPQYGSAYVFRKDQQDTWHLTQKLHPPEFSSGQEFGTAVGVSVGGWGRLMIRGGHNFGNPYIRDHFRPRR